MTKLTNNDVIKILYVYKYATYGGCERVILNRTESLLQHKCTVSIDTYFIQDLGGLKAFRRYIKENNLSNILQIATSPNFEEYDYIFSIDTPEIFDIVNKSFHHKIIIECHTPYEDNRKYLKELPHTVPAIIVPSPSFRETVIGELPKPLKQKVHVLNNIINVRRENDEKFIPQYTQAPLVFLGRLDRLKNPVEILEILKLLNTKSYDKYFAILIGNQKTDIDMPYHLRKLKFTNRVILLPEIPFEQIGNLFSFIKSNHGIFISASKGESFGLSAAEALTAGVPVLLSDLPSHKDILQHTDKYIYESQNITQAVKKLSYISSHYAECQHECMELSKPLLDVNFYDEFMLLLKKLGKPKIPKFTSKILHRHGLKQYEEITDPVIKMHVDYALSTVERGKDAVAEIDANYKNVYGKRVLDIGCAYGGFLIAFLLAGAKEVMGIDISHTLISYGNALMEDYSLDLPMYVKDISKIDDIQEYGKFDIITCFDVIEHLTNHADAIKNMGYLLDKNGIMSIEIPNQNHPLNILKDPHFNIPGLSVLPKQDADAYYNLLKGSAGNDVYYKDLEFYKKEFKKNGLSFIITNNAFNDNQLKQLIHRYEDVTHDMDKLKYKDSSYKDKIMVTVKNNLNDLKTMYHKYLTTKKTNSQKAFTLGQDIMEKYGIQSWKIVSKFNTEHVNNVAEAV